MRSRFNLLLLLVLSPGALAVVPQAASASYLLARDAKGISLRVNTAGTAQVTYRAQGKTSRVLLWGAINTAGTGPLHQNFKIDRSNGWKSKRNNPKRALRNACVRYDGPNDVPFLAAPICKAPDGTYWAVQKYQYTGSSPSMNYGARIGDSRYSSQLRVSHWSGPIATIQARANWSYNGRYQHMFGMVRYDGKGVYGKNRKANGACLDRICRNIAIDSLDPDYGPGWHRVNAILLNPPNGQWCFGFTPKGSSGGMRKTGESKAGRYRVYVSGPGVTPDPILYVPGPPRHYDPTLQQQMADIQIQWAGGSSNKCGTAS